MITYLPVLFAIVGVILMTSVSNKTVNKIGDYMLMSGVFWTIYATVGKTIALFGK